ncbi:polyubiquitin-like [Trachinotus anak]|uniref:polyubiquitin-like n=1 Tax=Trachinotus anak TaxID=443729 RepID=UPI0039F1F6A4
MDLLITTLSETRTLRVQPQDTVGSLKQVIHQELGVPAHKQRLVFVNGQKTDLSDDSRRLSLYGIQPGCRVSLLVVEPATIQVFLRRDGKTNTYDVKPEETVSDFRRRVHCRESVPIDQFRLNYEGKDLMDGRKLSDYNIGALSTVDMLFRLRGG